jgi:hypothetical protein
VRRLEDSAKEHLQGQGESGVERWEKMTGHANLGYIAASISSAILGTGSGEAPSPPPFPPMSAIERREEDDKHVTSEVKTTQRSHLIIPRPEVVLDEERAPLGLDVHIWNITVDSRLCTPSDSVPHTDCVRLRAAKDNTPRPHLIIPRPEAVLDEE